MTGTANALCTIDLFKPFSSEFQIFFTLSLYSLITFSLFKGLTVPTDSSVLLTTSGLFSALHFPLSMLWYAHFDRPKVIPISCENIVTVSSTLTIFCMLRVYSFRSSTKNNRLTLCCLVFPILYPSCFLSKNDKGFTESTNNIKLRVSSLQNSSQVVDKISLYTSCCFSEMCLGFLFKH